MSQESSAVSRSAGSYRPVLRPITNFDQDELSNVEALPVSGPNRRSHDCHCTGSRSHNGGNPRKTEEHHQDAGKGYAEIVQEIRVANGLAQALIAFQLGIGITNRINLLSKPQQTLYVTTLVLTITAIAILVTPIVFRRITLDAHREFRFAAGGRCVLAGLIMLGCSAVGSMFFALHVVFSFQLAISVGAGILAWFLVWWLIYPIWTKVRQVPTCVTRSVETD